MSDLKYVHPETLQEVEFKKLPKVYQEFLGSQTVNAPASVFFNRKKEELLEKAERKYKNKEEKKRFETDDGHLLATPLRAKKLGGLPLKKDKRYDPKKNWRYPYGKQPVEIRKPTSPDFGKVKYNTIYTKEYDVVHGAVKFEAIKHIAEILPEAKRKWQNGMLAKDEKTALKALMCAISYESPFRSGNKVSEKRVKTYGITNIKVKHCSLDKDKKGNEIIKFSFLGKGGEHIKKFIKNPIAVIKLKRLMKKKDGKDYLFTTSDGETITPNELNAYCKTLGIHHFHFFRHLIASRRFKEAVDAIIENTKIPDMPTSNEVSKIVINAAEESAKLLGNKGATCIKRYIAPQLIFDVFKRFELPVPDVYRNLAKLPDNITQKDWDEMYEEKYLKKQDDSITDEDDDLDEDEEEVVGSAEVIDEDVYFDDSKSTYREDELDREKFNDYILQYEYDDDDIINDPKCLKAIASVLVPTNFSPDFSSWEQFVQQRGDKYAVQKDTNYDCRENSDVNNWGYNDYVGVTPEEMNKKMMEQAKKDINKLLGDNNDTSV